MVVRQATVRDAIRPRTVSRARVPLTPDEVVLGKMMVKWARTIEEHGVQNFWDWIAAVNRGEITS